MASRTIAQGKPPRNKRTGGGKGVTGLRKDRLSLEEVEKRYGYTAAQMAIDPRIQKIFTDAWNNGWEKEQFQLEFETSDWWAENSDATRMYLLRSAKPDQDWLELKDDTYQAVRKEANALGVTLTDQQLRDKAEESLRKGWYLEENRYELRRALSQLQPTGKEFGGDIRSYAEELKKLAFDLGVNYDDNWFQSAGKSIAEELTDSRYWENDIKNKAAQLFPGLADQIRAGQTTRGIASPYLQMMQDEWEVNPLAVPINDPVILRALTGGPGEGGRSGPMDLGSFQQMLRKDPRWMNTAKAQNNITGTISGLMQMFGLRG